MGESKDGSILSRSGSISYLDRARSIDSKMFNNFLFRWAYEKDISNPYANLVGIHRVIRWDLIDLRLLQYEALSFIVYVCPSVIFFQIVFLRMSSLESNTITS